MKKILPALFVFALSALSSCNNQCITPAEEVHDTIVVHDTITLTPDTVYLHAGEYINNIPCKTNIIHPEAPGKALLFLWLHGGVHHPQGFTLLRNDGFSAIQYTNVPKHAIEYLERNNIKAIVLCPMEKPRAFDPRGRVALTPSGEIALTLRGEIKMTPEKQTFFRGFL